MPRTPYAAPTSTTTTAIGQALTRRRRARPGPPADDALGAAATGGATRRSEAALPPSTSSTSTLRPNRVIHAGYRPCVRDRIGPHGPYRVIAYPSWLAPGSMTLTPACAT